MMKRMALLIALPALLQAGILEAEDNATNRYLGEAKGITAAYATQLQTELKAAMAAGGPVKAIDVCQTRAPEIAADLSAKTGWKVGRTSLRVRNQALNLPDAWERQVLTDFETRKTAGADPQALMQGELLTTDDGSAFRFMKAIPTQEVCLACHGETLTVDVAAALDRLYPDDQARGFRLGDLRGAFTLSKPVSTTP